MLSECGHRGISVLRSCGIRQEAGVICKSKFLNVRFWFSLVASDQECNETNDVRLVGGPTPTEGLVEICLNGVWGSVCDHNWDVRDAQVLCQQLGYHGSELLQF